MQYFMDEEYSAENYQGLNCQKYLEREFPELDLIISEKDLKLQDSLI